MYKDTVMSLMLNDHRYQDVFYCVNSNLYIKLLRIRIYTFLVL